MKSEDLIPEQVYSLPLRQSSLRDCLLCKRKFLFKHRWLLYPRLSSTALSRPVKVGTLVHWLRAEGPGGLDDFNAMLRERIAPLQQMVDGDEDPLGEAAAQIKTLLGAAATAEAIARIVWEKYPDPEGIEILCKETELRTGLLVPDAAGNPIPVDLEGVVDLAIRVPSTNRVWIRDIKVSSRDYDYTMTGYAFGLQARFYRLLLESFLFAREHEGKDDPGERVGDVNRVFGFVVDYIRMPTITFCGQDRDYVDREKVLSRGPRKGQTVQEREYFGEPKMDNYIQRCRQWYAEQGEGAIASFHVAFTEPLLCEEFYQHLRVGMAYTGCPPDPKLFPRDPTTSVCKSYQRTCEYYPLCCSDWAAWEQIIATRYEYKTPEQVRAETNLNRDSDNDQNGD
jgi:hypothetical protein